MMFLLSLENKCQSKPDVRFLLEINNVKVKQARRKFPLEYDINGSKARRWFPKKFVFTWE